MKHWDDPENSKEAREKILELVKEYYLLKTTEDLKSFEEGDRVSYSGRVYDEKEMVSLVSSSLDFWLTAGKYCNEFEKKFSEYFDVKHTLLTNSGSSANLLSFFALTSHELGDRRIKRGDEIITIACTFPSTINPILQYGAVPVFVDVNVNTLNIDESQIESAITDKTKAIIMAHTLGNPFDIKKAKEICDKHNLWLIEDCADALVSKVDNKYVGTFGDIAITSFFVAHFLFTSEGGATYTNNTQLYNIMKSMRGWGRKYECKECKSDCKKRYDQSIDYDCRYIFGEIGFNLKMTEMQASIGLAQLDKLDYFVEKRKENYNYLLDKLQEFDEYFIFPESIENSDVCWFCFPITLKENVPFTRRELTEYLLEKNIDNRLLFAGNAIRQPYFNNLIEGVDYKVVGTLGNTNYIMDNTFFVGNYPQLDNKMLDYIYKVIKEFVKN